MQRATYKAYNETGHRTGSAYIVCVIGVPNGAVLLYIIKFRRYRFLNDFSQIANTKAIRAIILADVHWHDRAFATRLIDYRHVASHPITPAHRTHATHNERPKKPIRRFSVFDIVPVIQLKCTTKRDTIPTYI